MAPIISANPLFVCDQGGCPARATTPVEVTYTDPHSGLRITSELEFCAHHAGPVRAAVDAREPAPVP